MNILIADDHEIMRDGLIRIIKDAFTCKNIEQASCGKQAESIAREGKWDILIMDMSMPDKTGLDVLKQLRSEENRIPVLILSIHPENQYAFRVLKCGGNGYISKDCPREELILAIKTILNGKKYISNSLSERMAMHFDEDFGREDHELISDRELQVLKLISLGKTISQIAKELSLSVATISTYRARLLDKMNLKNSAELMRYAINNQLV